MNVRSLTPEGIERANVLLDAMKAGEPATVSPEFLNHPDFSDDTGISIGKPPAFESRYNLALWLNQQLDGTSMVGGVLKIGTWTWLTMALLDVVAPVRADGTRNIGARPLYVLEPDNWRRYYRHLLAGPVLVMRAHWGDLGITQAILAGKPHIPGELYEQIASRQEVVTSHAVVALTRKLYWDAQTKALKRGSGGKGAGSPRRLSSLLEQLDVTWDFGEMTEDSLIALLPHKEFARFMKEPPVEYTETS